ncbi:unnamed protein product [Vitrella brassicaformis CCMP3155]|uniref:AB hydrolase-1 domain-containing protein n=1 Tax=Vitrella brassicaformis (strain CCMP3155) TaxID=1169540 RepID=A0A0G4FY60_VITBC|nr:unnamed protein product [Vitrella brassicaformis CCMP3155]|eukprot:CEM20095.1 unnamed protein product [Vitrella brassicaformis CCMP3155]
MLPGSGGSNNHNNAAAAAAKAAEMMANTQQPSTSSLIKASLPPATRTAAAKVVALLLGLAVFVRRKVKVVAICHPSELNRRILHQLRRYLDAYFPAWVGFNAHIATGIGFGKSAPNLEKLRQRETLGPLYDGGTICLDWHFAPHPPTDPHQEDAPPPTPIILCIHGINGHSDESYLRHMLSYALENNMHAVALNLRGCAGQPLTSPFTYSAACTSDLHYTVHHIHERFPHNPLFLVGFSLGGNLMVKFLSEEGHPGGAAELITAAVAVANPWDLVRLSVVRPTLSVRFYRFLMCIPLKHLVRSNWHQISRLAEPPYSVMTSDELEDIRRYVNNPFTGGFPAFDEVATSKAHGHRTAQEYYTEASSARYVESIKTPLLAINALDDPVVHPSSLPRAQILANPNIILITTDRGGHIGWMDGFPNFLWSESWADRLALAFCKTVLQERQRGGEGSTKGQTRGDGEGGLRSRL